MLRKINKQHVYVYGCNMYSHLKTVIKDPDEISFMFKSKVNPFNEKIALLKNLNYYKNPMLGNNMYTNSVLPRKFENGEFNYLIEEGCDNIDELEPHELLAFFELFNGSFDFFSLKKILQKTTKMVQSNKDPNQIPAICKLMSSVFNYFIMTHKPFLKGNIPADLISNFLNENLEQISNSSQIMLINLIKLIDDSTTLTGQEIKILEKIIENSQFIMPSNYIILVCILANAYLNHFTHKHQIFSQDLIEHVRHNEPDQTNPVFPLLRDLDREPLMNHKIYLIEASNARNLNNIFSSPHFLEVIKKFPVISTDLCYIFEKNYRYTASHDEFIANLPHFLELSGDYPAHEFYKMLVDCEANIKNFYCLIGLYHDHIRQAYPAIFKRNKHTIDKFREISLSVPKEEIFVNTDGYLEYHLMYAFKNLLNDYTFLKVNIQRDPENIFDMEREQMCKALLKGFHLVLELLLGFDEKMKAAFVDSLNKLSDAESADKEGPGQAEFWSNFQDLVNVHQNMFHFFKHKETQMEFYKAYCPEVKDPIEEFYKTMIVVKDR